MDAEGGETKARRAGIIVTPHRAGQGTQPSEGVVLVIATEHGFEEVDQNSDVL